MLGLKEPREGGWKWRLEPRRKYYLPPLWQAPVDGPFWGREPWMKVHSLYFLKVETQRLSACSAAEPRTFLFLLKVTIRHPFFWFPSLRKVGIGHNPTTTSYQHHPPTCQSSRQTLMLEKHAQYNRLHLAHASPSRPQFSVCPLVPLSQLVSDSFHFTPSWVKAKKRQRCCERPASYKNLNKTSRN